MSEALGVGVLGGQEPVVGPVRHDHHVRMQRLAVDLEEPQPLQPRPAGHTGVHHLDRPARMALPEQPLELPRVSVVLVDVEPKRDRVADAEHAERAVVGTRELPLGSAVPLRVVVDGPRVVPAERLRVHGPRLVCQRLVSPEKEDVRHERARVDGGIGLEDLDHRLDRVALPRRPLEPLHVPLEARTLVDEAPADVLDGGQETREHHDPGEELERKSRFRPDPRGRGNLRSERPSHRAGMPAAARRTGASVKRRAASKRSAVPIATSATVYASVPVRRVAVKPRRLPMKTASTVATTDVAPFKPQAHGTSPAAPLPRRSTSR